MIAVSSAHPKVLFQLDGIGEDGDIWRKYFKNGKVHRANVEIVIEPFDEDELVAVGDK